MKLTVATEWQAWLRDLKSHRQFWQQWLGVWLAAALSFGVAIIFPSPEKYWITVSALLGLYFSQHFLRLRNFVLWVVASLLMGGLAWLTSWLAAYPIPLAIFLFVLMFALLFSGLRYELVWPATFVASFYALISAGLPTTMVGSRQRFYSIVLGFGIAIAVQWVLTRGRTVTALRYRLAGSLIRLARLSQAIFQCYVTHNYTEVYFSYEKKLHQCRSEVLYELQQTRILLNQVTILQRDEYGAMVDYIEQLYEILQSLGLMAQRVDDHATFAVAEKELLTLSSVISGRLRQLATSVTQKQREPASATTLSEAIFEMEEVSRTVLQVVARDPLVFTIFIQDLYALDRLCLQFTAALQIEGKP